ncbi:MAG TPA: DJ-1/PfpI family protein [Allocoleopsis sp.]
MKLKGKKIGILIESDFYEHEIWYYKYRFPEEGAELNFLTKLWGNPSLTFKGHEYHAPFECNKSFEDISDEELDTYSAIIVPAGMVSDRLRWSEDPQNSLPSACAFLRKVFAKPNILKGVICHGLWLLSPISEVVKGRKLVCHNNLYNDALHMGAIYTNEDVVVDGDLVTGRSGGHAGVFANKIIEILAQK